MRAQAVLASMAGRKPYIRLPSQQLNSNTVAESMPPQEAELNTEKTIAVVMVRVPNTFITHHHNSHKWNTMYNCLLKAAGPIGGSVIPGWDMDTKHQCIPALSACGSLLDNHTTSCYGHRRGGKKEYYIKARLNGWTTCTRKEPS